MHRCQQESEVLGHRLLLGEQREDALLDLVGQGVEVGVLLDDGFGQAEVCLEQRSRRRAQGTRTRLDMSRTWSSIAARRAWNAVRMSDNGTRVPLSRVPENAYGK